MDSRLSNFSGDGQQFVVSTKAETREPGTFFNIYGIKADESIDLLDTSILDFKNIPDLKDLHCEYISFCTKVLSSPNAKVCEKRKLDGSMLSDGLHSTVLACGLSNSTIAIIFGDMVIAQFKDTTNLIDCNEDSIYVICKKSKLKRFNWSKNRAEKVYDLHSFGDIQFFRLLQRQPDTFAFGTDDRIFIVEDNSDKQLKTISELAVANAIDICCSNEYGLTFVQDASNAISCFSTTSGEKLGVTSFTSEVTNFECYTNYLLIQINPTTLQIYDLSQVKSTNFECGTCGCLILVDAGSEIIDLTMKGDQRLLLAVLNEEKNVQFRSVNFDKFNTTITIEGVSSTTRVVNGNYNKIKGTQQEALEYKESFTKRSELPKEISEAKALDNVNANVTANVNANVTVVDALPVTLSQALQDKDRYKIRQLLRMHWSEELIIEVTQSLSQDFVQALLQEIYQLKLDNISLTTGNDWLRYLSLFNRTKFNSNAILRQQRKQLFDKLKDSSETLHLLLSVQGRLTMLQQQYNIRKRTLQEKSSLKKGEERIIQ